MSTPNFFKSVDERSRIKSFIVSEYFSVWAKVMLSKRRMDNPRHMNKNIHYLEAFCGPGAYHDGTLSTPLLVLEKAVSDPKISQHLVTNFIDNDESYCASLEQAIAKLPGISNLTYKPRVICQEVDEQLAQELGHRSLVPTLLFADPFGYKGLSIELFESILKDFGSECVFFFNYNRINAAVTNSRVPSYVNALFGKRLAQDLRNTVPYLIPHEREEAIMRALNEAFQESSEKHVQTFCFRKKDQSLTSHYLVFVTKAFRGYDIMKQIMAKYSSNELQGVPTFMYDSRDKTSHRLFEVGQPLLELKKELLVTYEGQSMTMKDIYEHHSIGRSYIAKNYKQALYELLEEHIIEVNRYPRKNTFADNIIVTFP